MQGDKGDKGVKGMNGTRGPKGENGTIGFPGLNGTMGDEGMYVDTVYLVSISSVFPSCIYTSVINIVCVKR